MVLDHDGELLLTMPKTDIPMCPLRRLRRAYLSIHRCAEAVCGRYGLTYDQYSLMRIVQRDPGIRQNELATGFLADANTVSAMVKLLEKRGLIQREPRPGDARARSLYLTSEGKKLVRKVFAEWSPLRGSAFECFDGESGEAALAILDGVVNTMTRGRTEFLQRTSPKNTAKVAKREKQDSSDWLSVSTKESTNDVDWSKEAIS